MPHSVLIVEDEPLARRRLEAIVQQVPELEVAATAPNAAEARRALQQRPDVMLVDLGLPDGSGVDLIRDARTITPTTRSLVITVFADEQHVMRAIRAGAQGYLLKDGSPEYMGNAILELLAGGSPISAPIARYLLQSLGPEPAPSAPPDGGPELSARELEILSLVAKGFSVAEAAELLKISDRTVSKHVQHIYRKLEVTSRSEAIYEAVNLGLINLKS
jgi:DNA-binding NarL/FixJ family response regulator